MGIFVYTIIVCCPSVIFDAFFDLLWAPHAMPYNLELQNLDLLLTRAARIESAYC